MKRLNILIILASLVALPVYGQDQSRSRQSQKIVKKKSSPKADFELLFGEYDPKVFKDLARILEEDREQVDEKLVTLFKKYQSRNAQSCESVYYGLFTDGFKQKNEFTGDGLNLDESYTRTDQEIDVQLQDPLERKRLEDKVSALFSTIGNIIKTEVPKDPNFFQLKALNFERGRRIDSTQIDVRFSAENGTFMTILDEMRPLGSMSRSIGTSTGGFNISPMTDGESKSKSAPVMTMGYNKLARIKSSAALAFTIGHELGHIVDIAPKGLTACLALPLSMGIQLNGTYYSDSKPKGDQFRSGRGTGLVSTFESLIQEGRLDDATELLKQAKQSGKLPSQAAEAIADYIGTKAVTEYIKSHYSTREARRNAALAVLFDRPPMLYSEEGEKIMNQVGSKTTNQRRVLRGILAQTEFRNLIGCQFDNAFDEPIDCSKPTFSQDMTKKYEQVKTWIRGSR